MKLRRWKATAVPPAERARLARLIKKHHGNLTAIAADWNHGMSRQLLTHRIKAHGLLEDCTAARYEHGVRGPQPRVAVRVMQRERKRVLEVLARYPRYEQACRALGISRPKLYRRMRALGISPAAILAHRAMIQVLDTADE